jgi:FtsH-binding integral membrane protein
MNKKILYLLLITILTVPSFSYAKELKELINGLKNSLIGLGASLATIAFIVAGISFLTATVNPERMKLAKGALVAAVIGIIIILLANNACQFIDTLFGGGVGSCI